MKKDAVELKKQIGYLPSEINLYDDFTVKHMLDYHEKFYEEDIHEKRTYLVDKLKLDEKKKIEDLKAKGATIEYLNSLPIKRNLMFLLTNVKYNKKELM